MIDAIQQGEIKYVESARNANMPFLFAHVYTHNTCRNAPTSLGRANAFIVFTIAVVIIFVGIDLNRNRDNDVGCWTDRCDWRNLSSVRMITILKIIQIFRIASLFNVHVWALNNDSEDEDDDDGDDDDGY